MDVLINFGDVFLFGEDEFVFLGYSVENDIVYAAKILTREHSKQLLNLDKNKQQKNSHDRNSTVYCFVVLKTKKFQERIAWMATAGKDGAKTSMPLSTLDPKDLGEIKNEILDGPLPEDLKEIIRKST